ncbi:MAG TPA: hypothetical protein VFV34_24070 [Blastocatellia bacterium]|nr:hypothetical protein [Blastocatellia bacterium]
MSAGRMSEGFARKKSEWTLTKVALDGLLGWLDADHESAGKKYEHIRKSLVRFFEVRGCHLSEELADETIDRVARRLHEGVAIKTSNPFLYFYGVGVRVLREYYRKQNATVWVPPQIDSADLHERLTCMEVCLTELTDDARELLLEYCRADNGASNEKRKRIADRMGISLNTLRIRVHRLRAQLESCVAECMSRRQRRS